jgi:hypothetical protein
MFQKGDHFHLELLVLRGLEEGQQRCRAVGLRESAGLGLAVLGLVQVVEGDGQVRVHNLNIFN